MPRVSSITPSSQPSGGSCGVTLHPQETYPWVRQLVAWLLRKQQCEVMTSMCSWEGRTLLIRGMEKHRQVSWLEMVFLHHICAPWDHGGRRKGKPLWCLLTQVQVWSLKRQCLWVLCLHLFVKRSHHHWEMNFGAFNMTCDVQVVLDFSLASTGCSSTSHFPRWALGLYRWDYFSGSLMVFKTKRDLPCPGTAVSYTAAGVHMGITSSILLFVFRAVWIRKLYH